MVEEYETVECDCHPLIIYLLTVTQKWAGNCHYRRCVEGTHARKIVRPHK
jgi:hypothetical protein